MSQVTKVETAQEYYDRWYPELSETQAESLANIKDACDAMIVIGGKGNKLNAASVGGYCQNKKTGTGKVPPAPQTIRNMKITVDGLSVHVYRDYLRKRATENSGARPRTGTKTKEPADPSFIDLAKKIKDDDTRAWVLDLIQRWTLSENSCDFMAKQLEHHSKEVGGFDLAGAITEGPTTENPMNLPMMSPAQESTVVGSEELLSALKAILSIPDNQEIPYLFLNSHGALVWDSGTGPEVLLSPNQWAAIVKAVVGGD